MNKTKWNNIGRKGGKRSKEVEAFKKEEKRSERQIECSKWERRRKVYGSEGLEEREREGCWEREREWKRERRGER